METNDTLIYSKRYPTLDDEIMRDQFFDDRDNVISIVKKALNNRMRQNALASSDYSDNQSSKPITIEYVPDISRLEKAETFISMVKLFSERYHVSADIYREKTKINAWLYFGTDVLKGRMKSDLIKLFDFADELSGVPRPKGMEDWCDVAVMLDYMTHHSFIEGRELHPFK